MVTGLIVVVIKFLSRCFLICCVVVVLVPSRFESREGCHLYQEAACGATLPARTECVYLHRPARSVSAPADGPGHGAHLPALHRHRGQAHH